MAAPNGRWRIDVFTPGDVLVRGVWEGVCILGDVRGDDGREVVQSAMRTPSPPREASNASTTWPVKTGNWPQQTSRRRLVGLGRASPTKDERIFEVKTFVMAIGLMVAAAGPAMAWDTEREIREAAQAQQRAAMAQEEAADAQALAAMAQEDAALFPDR